MITSAFSPYIICDSKEIEKILRKKFFRKKNITTIEYGAHINKTVHLQNSVTRSILEKYNLTSMKYHLVVSRLEPENNIDTIIIGYSKNTRKFPLIIVGNISQTKYVRNLTDLQNKEVTFVGGIYDSNELNVIRSNAYSYIHGHSVGGTNPSLLEAMASKNLCVCHENEFNKGLVGKDGFYFKTSTEISSIFEKIEESNLDAMRGRVYEKIRDYYNWENITNLYISYFQKISK
jgi:rhamnosyltransferase